MKVLFFSDLHGDAKQAKAIIDIFNDEKANFMVGCGDFLYHGPRNALSDHYETKQVTDLLNSYKDKIVGVRGNCDSEVDQMVLEFPMSSDYTVLLIDGRRFFVTHGHLYSMESLPLFLSPGDIFVQGHTHVASIKDTKGITCFNPGSTTLPRSSIGATYAVYYNSKIEIKLLEGRDIILEESL